MDDLIQIIETALDHHRAGRLDDASAIYLSILEIQPDYAPALNLLGALELEKGATAKAMQYLSRAVLTDPSVADYHSNLAAAYHVAGDRLASLRHAERAVGLDPDLADAHYNLGDARFGTGDVSGAVNAFDTARHLNADHSEAWSNYLFSLNFLPEVSAQEVSEANREWGQSVEKKVRQLRGFTGETGDRIRLAYFIPELDEHVTVRFLEPMLAHHDREKFEILGFGHRRDGARAPEQLVRQFASWHDTYGRTPAEIADAMRGEEVHILLHPCTFKARYREVLAYRGAPIQIACTNVLSTTGLKSTDFMVLDGVLAPSESSEAFYTESLIRLPSFNVYSAPAEAPAVSSLNAISAGHVTFGSFNNIYKLSDETVELWSEVMRAVPGSRLMLKHRALETPEIGQEILSRFEQKNIETDRIILRGFSPNFAEYLSAYCEVDIALDPIPLGGGTTTYEAIWMGVPVLTLQGENHIMARVSASLMKRCGMDQFVATTRQEYVQRAAALVSDLDALEELRRLLRPKAAATIFNAENYMQNFEAALLRTWRDRNAAD